MLSKLKQQKQLDDLILEEVNVKCLTRGFGTTDRGDLNIVYDGEYSIELGGEKVNAPKTLEILLKIMGVGNA